MSVRMCGISNPRHAPHGIFLQTMGAERKTAAVFGNGRHYGESGMMNGVWVMRIYLHFTFSVVFLCVVCLLIREQSINFATDNRNLG